MTLVLKVRPGPFFYFLARSLQDMQAHTMGTIDVSL